MRGISRLIGADGPRIACDVLPKYCLSFVSYKSSMNIDVAL